MHKFVKLNRISFGIKQAMWGTIGFTAFLLTTTSPALADYIPPTDSSAPSRNITTTGRRGGCQGNETASFTTLAPRSHIGQSVSTHPTLTWFVPETEVLAIELYLYQSQPSGEQLIYQTRLPSFPGVMSLSLPTTEPPLQVGQRYRWQVVLLCNENSPSSALVADAEITVIAPSHDLTIALAATRDRVDRATLFARFGFWYDAIAQVTNPSDPTLRATQTTLLTNLADIEAASGDRDRSTQLRQIIDYEQSVKASYQSE